VSPPTSKTPGPLVVAARLGATFGVHGELACLPTRIGEDALRAGLRVRAEAHSGEGDDVTIAAIRHHHGRLLVALEGVATVEEARALTGRSLLIARDAVVLRDGEYLDDDLVGLRLEDEAGGALGVVSGVRHFPAQDCLVVGPGNAFVPLVRAFIREVDVAGGRIVVSLPPGLLDERLAEEA